MALECPRTDRSGHLTTGSDFHSASSLGVTIVCSDTVQNTLTVSLYNIIVVRATVVTIRITGRIF